MKQNAARRLVACSEGSALDDEIYSLLGDMTDKSLLAAGVIPWSSPVPVFGDPGESVVATVGLNPSNREFVDASGEELNGLTRRFPTLKSLGLRGWAQADGIQAARIGEACRTYFSANPYDLWFKALDKLIQGTGASFYPSRRKACHLDLVPFATLEKWTALSTLQRATLLKRSCQVLPRLLSSSRITTLVLNGATVVREVQNAFQFQLEATTMPSWRLKRDLGEDVQGIAYRGTITSIAGLPLDRDITVLGYNYNIQSSFGITREVRTEIARWIMDYAGDSGL